MSKQIEKLRKEFEEQFCEDAGNIKMLKDLYGYKIWEWINENFVPLDEPVKHDFCEWGWDNPKQTHKIGCGGYIGQGVDMLFEKVKYCPYCGKKLNKVYNDNKNSV